MSHFDNLLGGITLAFLLRNSLAMKNYELSARYIVIQEKARSLLEYSQGGAHLTYTPHGYSHISAVEKNIDWLLSQNDIDNLNEIEQFCLLCSISFHDALMIPSKLGEETETRLKHAENAGNYLTSNGQSLGLNFHEARIIGLIIHGHALDNFSTLPDGEVLGNSLVDIRKLAAILSMADICHADSSRAPEIVFHYLDFNEESESHWRKHLQISGITRRDDTIIMSAIYFSEKGFKAIEEYKNKIKKQLEIVKPYFSSKLSTISKVELQAQKFNSPFDIPHRFQTNTEAIVDILIQGIYQHEDVFIREIVQNSLDACNLRYAKEFRRKEIYSPEIIITCLSVKGRLVALRVDDNGIGMDLNDFTDTVLWIGNSIRNKEEVQKLLKSTTGKNLIATFGVGLLSCFKVAKNIIIRSKKENRDSVSFSTTSIKDDIHFVDSSDNSIGTTIIIELQDAFSSKIDIQKAMKNYFRRVQFKLQEMNLEWNESILNMKREEICKLSKTKSNTFESQRIMPKNCAADIEILGDDYTAWFWIEEENLALSPGRVTILNEGIFVCIDDTTDWLPNHLQFVNGAIDFFSQAINLPVSRDKVIQNNKMDEKKLDLSRRSMKFLDKLVNLSKGNEKKTGDSAALMICFALQQAESNIWKEKILNGLDNYFVKVFLNYRDISLKEICESNPKKVFLEYSQGNYVNLHTDYDGKRLWYASDEDVSLYARQLRGRKEFVISASRLDLRKDLIVLESDLLKNYFKNKCIKCVDLTSNTDEVNETIDYLALPVQTVSKVGVKIAFSQLTEFPNRKGIKIGSEIVFNAAHPKMNLIYKELKNGIVSNTKSTLVKILALLLASEFEKAIGALMDLIISLPNVEKN